MSLGIFIIIHTNNDACLTTPSMVFEGQHCHLTDTIMKEFPCVSDLTSIIKNPPKVRIVNGIFVLIHNLVERISVVVS